MRYVFGKKALIKSTASTKEALIIIDKAAVQIGLVVDKNNTLLGTVTDGDVRRSILKGLSLDVDIARGHEQVTNGL